MKPAEPVATEPVPPALQEYERPEVTDLGAWAVITLAQSFPITSTDLFDPGQQQW